MQTLHSARGRNWSSFSYRIHQWLMCEWNCFTKSAADRRHSELTAPSVAGIHRMTTVSPKKSNYRRLSSAKFALNSVPIWVLPEAPPFKEPLSSLRVRIYKLWLNILLRWISCSCVFLFAIHEPTSVIWQFFSARTFLSERTSLAKCALWCASITRACCSQFSFCNQNLRTLPPSFAH